MLRATRAAPLQAGDSIGNNRRVAGWPPLCGTHRSCHRRTWGHELVRSLPRREITAASRRVAALLSVYRSGAHTAGFHHPALLRAVNALDSWLIHSALDTRVPGLATVARIAATGMRADRLLVPVIVAWLMAREEPNRYPDSQVLSCLIGTLVHRYAASNANGPQAVDIRRKQSSDTRAIGEYVRATLAGELNRIVDGILYADRRTETLPRLCWNT